MPSTTVVITFIGYLAAACTTAAFFPQAIRIWKTRDTSGISLPTFVVFSLGVSCWLIYGIGVGEWPIVAANALTIIPSVGIVWMTARQRMAERDPGTGTK
jgi:MtN3 and saliva related transmembrane protein